jgi:large subunit ribosomal protein L22
MADNIRGKKVEEAMNMLRFSKNESAAWLYKVLLSAVANWEYKLNGAESADDYHLYVKRAVIDEASMLKRFRPATHGRASRIHKRRNHITLIVENKIPLSRDMASAETEAAAETTE